MTPPTTRDPAAPVAGAAATVVEAVDQAVHEALRARPSDMSLCLIGRLLIVAADRVAAAGSDERAHLRVLYDAATAAGFLDIAEAVQAAMRGNARAPTPAIVAHPSTLAELWIAGVNLRGRADWRRRGAAPADPTRPAVRATAAAIDAVRLVLEAGAARDYALCVLGQLLEVAAARAAAPAEVDIVALSVLEALGSAVAAAEHGGLDTVAHVLRDTVAAHEHALDW
jgi:hypothetical protein